MDYNQRSRGQKSGVGRPARPPRRSMGSRLGLEKQGTPVQPPRRSGTARPDPERSTGRNPKPRRGQAPNPQRPGQGQQPNSRRPRPQQQINPQKSGYTPGSPRRPRRVTQAEILRNQRRRRFLSLLAVLAVLAIGAIVSVNLLFKVTIFRVENFDHTTPVDTGIYTEDEIITALNIEKNSNLFGFSTEEKTKELQAQFPYLDKVEVDIQMPASVVVRLTPATERFACMYSGGWMILSDSLRILRLEISQPEGMILLKAKLPDNFSPVIGQQVIPETYNSLLTHAEEEAVISESTASGDADGKDAATPESAQPAVTDIMTKLWQLLQDNGLLDGLTALDISDTSQLSFTYQDRVVIQLGNSSSLDYKLRMTAKILTDPEKGLSGSDRGTLDVSDQLEDGEIRGYFQPYEQPTPTPEPTPEPDPESTDTEQTDEPPTE